MYDNIYIISVCLPFLLILTLGKSTDGFIANHSEHYTHCESRDKILRKSFLCLPHKSVALCATNSVRDASDELRETKKEELLNLLSCVPSNVSTPKKLTTETLQAVRALEEYCPTPDENVLESLGGNWELIWTAQDRSSLEGRTGLISNWIK